MLIVLQIEVLTKNLVTHGVNKRLHSYFSCFLFANKNDLKEIDKYIVLMLSMGFQINDSRTKWIELFPMQPSKRSRIHRNLETKKFFEILRLQHLVPLYIDFTWRGKITKKIKIWFTDSHKSLFIYRKVELTICIILTWQDSDNNSLDFH